MTDNYIKRVTIEGEQSISTLKEMLNILKELNRYSEVSTRLLDTMSTTLMGLAGSAKSTAASMEELNQRTERQTSILQRNAVAAREAASAHQHLGTLATRYKIGKTPTDAPYDDIRQAERAYSNRTTSEEALARAQADYARLQNRLEFMNRPPSGAVVEEERYQAYQQARADYARLQTRLEFMSRADDLERQRAAAGGGDGGGRYSFGRHIQWFLQGTAIYYAINAVMQGVGSLLKEVTTRTSEWSSALEKLRYVSGGGASDLQKAANQLQGYGIAPGQAYNLRILAGRGGYSGEEQESLTRSAGLLMALSEGRIEEAQAMEMVRGILKQYNMEATEASRVVDILASMYKRGTESIEDNAMALAAMGSLSRLMGLSLNEMSGYLIGFTEVTDKSGTELATIMEQMLVRIGRSSQMRSLGIDIAGKTPWQVLQEASILFQGAGQEDRRTIAEKIGGTKFISETTAILQNFGLLTTKVAESGDAAGEAAKMYDALGKSVEGSAERARAAAQLATAEAINVGPVGDVRKAAYSWLTTSRMGYVYASQLHALGREERLELADQWMGYVSAQGVSGYTLGEARHMVEWLRSPTAGVLRGASMLQNWATLQKLWAEFAGAGTGGVRIDSPFASLSPLAPPIAGFGLPTPLSLLNQDVMTPATAEKFEAAVSRWNEFYEKATIDGQRLALGEMTASHYLVRENGVLTLKEIAAYAESIQASVSEINERQRQQGTWNLPGMAIGNLDSFQSLLNRTPVYSQISPLIGGGFMFGEGQLPEPQLNAPRERWRKGGPQEGWTVNVPVYLDGRQIGQAVASIHGGDLQSRWEMGEDRGAGYISSTGGVI